MDPLEGVEFNGCKAICYVAAQILTIFCWSKFKARDIKS